MNAIFVMIGGALGALSRYGVAQMLSGIKFISMPIGTLTVNLVGCLLLGVLTAVSEKHLPLPFLDEQQSRQLMLLLMTGFCGAFTTFSTFSAETIKVMDEGFVWQPLLYVLISVTVGFLLFWCGKNLI